MEAEKKDKVRKVIIDTDPGIDDAMAIMIALKEHKKGNIDILAITLVNGNSSTDNAQVNILRVLKVFELQNEVRIVTLEVCPISTAVLLHNILYLPSYCMMILYYYFLDSRFRWIKSRFSRRLQARRTTFSW